MLLFTARAERKDDGGDVNMAKQKKEKMTKEKSVFWMAQKTRTVWKCEQVQEVPHRCNEILTNETCRKSELLLVSLDGGRDLKN